MAVFPLIFIGYEWLCETSGLRKVGGFVRVSGPNEFQAVQIIVRKERIFAKEEEDKQWVRLGYVRALGCI